MNKKDDRTAYVIPEIEIVKFEGRDIVTSSVLSNDDGLNYDSGAWT